MWGQVNLSEVSGARNLYFDLNDQRGQPEPEDKLGNGGNPGISVITSEGGQVVAF